MNNINLKIQEKNKLNLDYNKEFTHEIKKNDILKISPTSGSIANLNRRGDIVFQSLQTSNPNRYL